MDSLINSAAKQDQTRELLFRLWQRSLPVLHQRLDVLDTAAQAEILTTELRAHAIDAAHKLAGSLGMFGYPKSTDIARKIELLLEAADAAQPEHLTILTTELRTSLFPSS